MGQHGHNRDAKDEGIEIPPAVKRHLGLDDEPSWVLPSEGNKFVWPGYDIRKRRGGGSYSYGFLPPRLFDRIAKAFVDWRKTHAGAWCRAIERNARDTVKP